MILCSNPSEQFKSYQSEIENAVISVMRGNSYVLGEQVKILEREFAEYIGVSSVIGVANGTDAIEIALRALNIGFDDEVITVSHTAVATIAAIEAFGMEKNISYISTAGGAFLEFVEGKKLPAIEILEKRAII